MNRKAFHHASEGVRRQDLIEATLDCIADFGLRGTTVRQIAQRAGVTGGLIRHYFSAKEPLMQAAYAALMERLSKSAVEAAGLGPTPRERLRAYIMANFTGDVMDARLMSLWATFIGQIRSDPSIAAIHRVGYLQFRDELERRIAEFQAERDAAVTAADIRHQAIAINALIDGLWLEGCMAADLFRSGELAQIALSGSESILGRSLGGADDNTVFNEGSS